MIPSRRLPPGQHHICAVVDVEDYSSRTPTQQLRIQAQVRDIVDLACSRAGVPGSVRQDRGDGQLVILPTGVDLPRVLPTLIHAVADRLAALNWSARGTDRVRMRGALASGAIQAGEVGFVGPAVVEAARLVDSEALRAALAERPDRHFALCVTDALYQDVVSKDHPGLTGDQFRAVQVTVKKYTGTAWVTVPQPRAEGAPNRLRSGTGRRTANPQDVIAATFAARSFLVDGLSHLHWPGGGSDHPPVSEPASSDRPGADRPGADRPGADQPGADQPGADQPGAADLIFTSDDDRDGGLTFTEEVSDIPALDDSDWQYALPLDSPWFDPPHDPGGTADPHRR